MKNRVLIALATALMLAGCTTGGPNDVALISGQKIGQADVQAVVADWANDPLYTELAKIVGEEPLKEQASSLAQQSAASRRVMEELAKKHGVTLPDDAAVQQALDQQLGELGGLDGIQKQIIEGAQQTGMVQGVVSLNQLRDQVRTQLNAQAIADTLPLEDADVDAFIAQAGLPADQVNDQIRAQARDALRQERFQKEVETLGIKVNPRLQVESGAGVLGQTTQTQPGGEAPGGQLPIQPQPGQ